MVVLLGEWFCRVRVLVDPYGNQADASRAGPAGTPL
ncbi:hypothetical protein J2S46_007004 [Kitasatospora herbaricolor]|nr:hypothetical protein [Kitasatospora herbaricolor]